MRGICTFIVYNVYVLSFKHEQLVCADAISTVAMKVNNSIKNNGSFKRMSSGSGTANITLSDLQQNEIYSANVTIEYNGGVTQDSQPVEISEWCTNM